MPDYTTVYRFLRRLPDDTIEKVLGESVRRLRRIEQHSHGKTRYCHFLRWLVVADVDRQIILAHRARQGP